MARDIRTTEVNYPEDAEVARAFSVRGDLRELWNAIERIRKENAEKEVRLDSHADQIADLQRLIGE